MTDRARRPERDAPDERGSIKAKLVVGMAVLLAAGGLAGSSVAFAAGGTPTTSQSSAHHAMSHAYTVETTEPTTAEADALGGHQDANGANVGSTAGGADPGTADGTEKAGAAEADGPGGHQDANGVDANSTGGHQDAGGADAGGGN
ncbi:MAG TPA: hypothetical protein VNG13_13800 [Mycobacteriales bacterium]|nr:hypothetical protein [Mycobacteriales bacterium]